MSGITIFKNTCKGVEDCGICIFVCPKDVFEPSDVMNEFGFVPPRVAHEDQCTDCLNCMISCPDMAIVVEKKKEKVKAKNEQKS
ncbi:MAG: ferredoxin family protein [Deltaproteobacteria bacterium]|nr:ferredoxin family protein [Deltaproteobacteria bacterium]MBW1962851.1 ferredoxin family protein [Deltaproteobacteria bacterium]MBW1994578.1 ferredoxin family protein [Deltaproteobacteria bacterium]MBW2154378.1 ferredoxin family protein [Deltaproteobacteria bacterium]